MRDDLWEQLINWPTLARTIKLIAKTELTEATKAKVIYELEEEFSDEELLEMELEELEELVFDAIAHEMNLPTQNTREEEELSPDGPSVPLFGISDEEDFELEELILSQIKKLFGEEEEKKDDRKDRPEDMFYI